MKRTDNWVAYAACPTCKVEAGERCVGIRKLTPLLSPHNERRINWDYYKENKRGLYRKNSALQIEILDYVANDWVPYEQVLSVFAPKIAPGIALRRMERLREVGINARGYDPEKIQSRHGTKDHNLTVYYGQRAIIQRSLISLSRQGRLEFQYVDPNAKRRKPTHVRKADVC